MVIYKKGDCFIAPSPYLPQEEAMQFVGASYDSVEVLRVREEALTERAPWLRVRDRTEWTAMEERARMPLDLEDSSEEEYPSQ